MGTITILPETTKNPITLMGQRAGVCWGGNVEDPEKNYKRGMDCIISGHGRVMEYVNVEMIIAGYSARVEREWYTHIGGSPTRLQSSTRYINYAGRGFDYIIPPSIQNNKEALEKYQALMAHINEECVTAHTGNTASYLVTSEKHFRNIRKNGAGLQIICLCQNVITSDTAPRQDLAGNRCPAFLRCQDHNRIML